MNTQTTNVETGFVCALGELPEGILCQYQAELPEGPTDLIVFRQGDQIRAWKNICPHQGRSLNWAPGRFLHDEQGHLVCAAHGAVFELERGDCVSGPCRGAALTRVEIRVTDCAVYLIGAA